VHHGIYQVSDIRLAAMHRGEIGAMITDSIADQVEKEMADWGSKSGAPNFVKALKDMVETNDVLLEDGKILRENS